MICPDCKTKMDLAGGRSVKHYFECPNCHHLEKIRLITRKERLELVRGGL